MSLFHHRSKEKRNFSRIPFWAKVEVDLNVDNAARSETLGVENLSEGGILVETTSAYPQDAPCRIHLKKNFFSTEVVLEGFIVRSVISRRGHFFDTGISFSNINPDQKGKLSQIIKLYSSNS
ncbi:MAG: PilZ domain-containing protein [Chlamydiae bacterium]|nr:PilZ domain-containing protein [Chlamydiota bacterium]MBI3276284.1 PilZ domain-containing protein [Chlamydiota bacterium]